VDSDVPLPLLPAGLTTPRKNMVTIHIPSILDEATAWFLGATIGDGSYRDVKDGTVDFTNQDAEVLARYRETLEKFGLRVCTYSHPSRDATRLYVVSQVFRQWLCLLGLEYSTACHKRVPKLIFHASTKIKAAFLKGLFDTDGSAGTGTCRTCRLVTCSSQLAKEVQLLLLSLGIIASRSKSGPNAYCIGVSGTSLLTFARFVGFTVSYKQQRLQCILEKAAHEPYRTNNDFVPNSRAIVADIANSLKLFYGKSKGIQGKGVWGAGQVRIGHIFDKVRRLNKSLTYRNIETLTQHLNHLNLCIPESLSSVWETNFFYDTIVSVEQTEEEAEMYDLEVDNLHSFVANGFVCHNSQGSEYPVVVLALHTQHYMLLQRNLLYTALTRAKKLAVLIGPQRAIAMAVKKQSDVGRHTRLKERLQGLL